MIQTLIDLVERDIEAASLQLADLEHERTRIAREVETWRAHLHFDAEAAVNGGDVAARLIFGARADRELKTLAEKDFLVETRISECRTELLALKRRQDTLREVVVRREHVRAQAAKRREERHRANQGAARKAAREGKDPWR
jgi:DNA repair exonuclease SbcCD ATPase subunit